MCIMTLIPAGTEAPWEGLAHGGVNNPDGHGWAVAQGDTLVVGKSMDLNEALLDFEAARDAMGGTPLSLFHSRIATAGLVTTFNVHPFYVGDSKQTVMAHNGVLPYKYQPKRNSDDQRSDTRLYAEDVAGPLMNPQTGVPSRRMTKVIGEDIARSNKFIFLSVALGVPQYRIVNSEMGVFQDGVWYSNRSFVKRTYQPVSTTRYIGGHVVTPRDYDWDRAPSKAWSEADAAWAQDWEDFMAETRADLAKAKKEGEDAGVLGTSTYKPAQCLKCKGRLLLGTCTDCGTCDDCLAPATECLCFTPRSLFEVRDKASDDEEYQKWLAQHASVLVEGDKPDDLVIDEEAEGEVVSLEEWLARHPEPALDEPVTREPVHEMQGSFAMDTPDTNS